MTIAQVKRNVKKMALMEAPEEEIDDYISLEGFTVKDIANYQEPTIQERFKPIAEKIAPFVKEATKPLLFQKPDIVKKGEAQLGREALMLPARALTPIPAGLTEAIKVGKKEGVLPAVKAGVKTAGKAFLRPMDYPAPELALTEQILPIQPFEQREYGKLGWIGNVPRAVAASMIQVLGWRGADKLMRVATTRALNPKEIEGITEAYGRELSKMPENVRQNVMPTGNLARVLLGKEQRVARPWVSKALGLKPFEAPKPSVKIPSEIPIQKPALPKPTEAPVTPVLAPKPPITAPKATEPILSKGREIAQVGDVFVWEENGKELGKITVKEVKSFSVGGKALSVYKVDLDGVESMMTEKELFRFKKLPTPSKGGKKVIKLSQEDTNLLIGMRGELYRAEPGKRIKTEENTWIAQHSTYPEWFKGITKSLTGKKALGIISKVEKGAALTKHQEMIFNSMLGGYKYEQEILAEKENALNENIPESEIEETIRAGEEKGLSLGDSEEVIGEGVELPPPQEEFPPAPEIAETQQIIPGAEAKFPEHKIPATKYDLIQEKTEIEKMAEKQKPSLIKPSQLDISKGKGYTVSEGESNYYEIPEDKRKNLPIWQQGISQSPVKVKYKKQGHFVFPQEKINSPADVAFAFQKLKNEAVERFYVVGVKNNIPISVEPMSIGIIDAALVTPYESLHLLNQKKADGYYLIHNHPSGSIEASDEDIKLSNEYKKAYRQHGLIYKGHIIINDTKFGFLDPYGDYEAIEHLKGIQGQKKVKQYAKYVEWTKSKSFGPVVKSPESVFEIIKGLTTDWNKNSLVFYLNTRNMIISSEFLPQSSIDAMFLSKTAAGLRAKNIIIVNLNLERLQRLQKDLSLYPIKLLDVINLKENKAFFSAATEGIIREKQPDFFLKPSYSMESGETPTGRMAGQPTGKKTIPPITATGKPISWEKSEPWQVNLGRNIPGVFEKEIGPRLQVSKRMKRFLGVYYPMLGESGTIRVRSIADEKTLNHEAGHFLDDVLGNYPIERNKDTRAELIALTKHRTPFTETYVDVIDKETGLPKISKKTGKPLKKLDTYSSYRRSKKELFAEFIAEYTSNPANARKLAPKFTARVEAEISKDKEFKYVISKLREFEKEFKPIKDFVNSLRQIPELQPLLKDWEERGNLLQNLWRKQVGDILWNKFSFYMDKLGEKYFLREFFEKGGINNKIWEILRQRKKLIDGQRAKFKEEIIDPMKKLSKEDQEYIATSLQRWEDMGKTNTELDLLTDHARGEIAVWGNELRKLGLLGDEAFWNNVGQYMPFLYEKREFDKNKAQFGTFPAKKIKANLSGVKHKLTDEEFGRRVMEAKLGTWPKQKAMIAAMPKETLVKIGRQARIDMGLIKTAAYPLQKRISQMIEVVYTVKAMNLIADMPGVVGSKNLPGFIKLPEAKKFGKLAGQYVSENLFREINSWQDTLSDIDKIVGAVNSAWKVAMVPWSPAAVSRNLVTNFLMAYFLDIPIYNPVVALGGMKSFISKDDTYKLLRDNGLYKHTYSQEELQGLAFMMEKDPDNIWEKIIHYGVKTFNTPGDFYGYIEDMSKTIIAKYVMSHRGNSQQAIKAADKVLFDYSSISKATKGARKFMLPFFTWSAKILPRLVEFSMRKPEKFLMILLALAAGSALSRKKLGITKEEEESLKPDYLKGKATLLFPKRDGSGDLNWINLSYFMPWDNWIPLENEKLAIPQALSVGNPFINFYNAYVLNYDKFYGQIAPDFMTDEEAGRVKKDYILKNTTPRIAQVPAKIVKSVKKVPDKYGRTTDLGKVIAGDIFGFKFVKDISPYKTKIRRKAIMDYHRGRRSIYERYKTGEITNDEKRRLFIKQRKKAREGLTR